MGGLFGGKPDNSAAQRQLEESKRENERLRAQQEEERRELAEKAEARRRARLVGGSRMLLSEARVAPEEGVTTLGASSTERMS